jgi:hypothetical protein
MNLNAISPGDSHFRHAPIGHNQAFRRWGVRSAGQSHQKFNISVSRSGPKTPLVLGVDAIQVLQDVDGGGPNATGGAKNRDILTRSSLIFGVMRGSD